MIGEEREEVKDHYGFDGGDRDSKRERGGKVKSKRRA